MKNKNFMRYNKLYLIVLIFNLLATISLLMSAIGVYNYYIFYNKTLTIIGIFVSILASIFMVFWFGVLDKISFNEEGVLVNRLGKVKIYKWEEFKNIKIINKTAYLYAEKHRPVSFDLTKELLDNLLNNCNIEKIKEKFSQINIK